MAKCFIVIPRVGFNPIEPIPPNWPPRWSYSSTHNNTLHLLQRTIGTRTSRGRSGYPTLHAFTVTEKKRYPGCLPSFSFLYGFYDAVDVVLAMNYAWNMCSWTVINYKTIKRRVHKSNRRDWLTSIFKYNLCMLCTACFLMFKDWICWKYQYNKYMLILSTITDLFLWVVMYVHCFTRGPLMLLKRPWGVKGNKNSHKKQVVRKGLHLLCHWYLHLIKEKLI